MIDKVKIYFIYAENCKECNAMKETVLRAMRDCKKSTVLDEVNSETDEAIELGLKYNVDSLPACIIGKFTFCGKYNYCGFIDAIEETWKEQQMI